MNAPLAQSVEQWTVNPCVAGSNPAGGVKVEESYFDKVPLFILKRRLFKSGLKSSLRRAGARKKQAKTGPEGKPSRGRRTKLLFSKGSFLFLNM